MQATIDLVLLKRLVISFSGEAISIGSISSLSLDTFWGAQSLSLLLEQTDDITEEVRIETLNIEQVIHVLLGQLSLLSCIFHRFSSVNATKILSLDHLNMYLQLFFSSTNIALEVLNSGIALADSSHACLILHCLYAEDRLLLFDLLFNIGDFFLSFLHFLICASSCHFGILIVSLQLVVARLELLNFLVLLNITGSLRLLHLSELIEKLTVMSLSHISVRRHGFVCSGSTTSHVRS